MKQTELPQLIRLQSQVRSKERLDQLLLVTPSDVENDSNRQSDLTIC
jgi:hypothetical protein